MDGEDNFKENEKPPPDEEVDELNEERKRRRRSLSVASTASSSRDTKRSRLVRTESRTCLLAVQIGRSFV